MPANPEAPPLKRPAAFWKRPGGALLSSFPLTARQRRYSAQIAFFARLSPPGFGCSVAALMSL
jgi:hypothetical protein